MHEQLWFTALLNKYLAAPVAAALSPLGIHFHDPHFVFDNVVAMEILVALLLLVFFILVRLRLSVEKPSGVQHIAEMLEDFINNQSRDVIGPHSEKFTPFLATLGVFILVSNLLGLVPGFESPTAAPVVPLFRVDDLPDEAEQVPLRVIAVERPGTYVLLEDIRSLLEVWAMSYDEVKNPSGAVALREALEALKEIG